MSLLIDGFGFFIILQIKERYNLNMVPERRKDNDTK